MLRKRIIIAIMLAVFIIPVVVPQAAAHELVPYIPGGPSIPPYWNEVQNYVYPSGKDGSVEASSSAPVVAYSKYKIGDYIMSVIITLESLYSDTSTTREATLMVSVFYTYTGTRGENLGGLSNVYLGMSKVYSSSLCKYAYAASFADDLQEDQRWYPHGFVDNGDLGQITGTLYSGFGKAISKVAGLVPGGAIAGKTIETFISWLGNKAAQDLNTVKDTGFSGLSAAIDMRNKYYPNNYHVDKDSSTTASDAFDFVGSFIVKLRYSRTMPSGSTFGLRFTFTVVKGNSASLSTTDSLSAPQVYFRIQMS